MLPRMVGYVSWLMAMDLGLRAAAAQRRASHRMHVPAAAELLFFSKYTGRQRDGPALRRQPPRGSALIDAGPVFLPFFSSAKSQ